MLVVNPEFGYHYVLPGRRLPSQLQNIAAVVWKVSSGWHENYINYCNATKSNILFITRAEKTRAASICNKSAITDHVCNENRVIDWANAKVIDWESDKAGRLIKEAIWIRKTDNMNWDEGSYQLSHVWDKLLHTDNWHRKSVLMKASDVKPKRR